ncbi:MAG: hypothetical protein Q8Q28_07800 [Pseudomonadota bacterium]|nr:hypothetical protein [Pseudomonadota bacterium]
MKILVCRLGNTDLRASLSTTPDDLGPIASALKALPFDELHLISDHPQQDTQAYIAWLNATVSTRIHLHETSTVARMQRSGIREKWHGTRIRRAVAGQRPRIPLRCIRATLATLAVTQAAP